MKHLLLCLLLTAAEIKAEQLTVNAEDIYVVSSFADRDFFTVYSHAGDVKWEAPLNAQIISWEIADEKLFIFSKARSGLAYFLICLNAADGKLEWEKGIFAPNSAL